MKGIVKWLGNVSVFIYAALMFFGNILMTIITSEMGGGLSPILIFNGVMVTAYLLGILSRFIKD